MRAPRREAGAFRDLGATGIRTRGSRSWARCRRDVAAHARRALHGPSGRHDGDGRRLAHDAHPRLPLRHPALDGDRHRHRARRGVQVGECGAAPADGKRPRAACRVDAHRLGAGIALRRLAQRPADRALRRRRRVGDGPGARRRTPLRCGRVDREERRPGRSDRRSRLEPLEPRSRGRRTDRDLRRLHRRPDLRRQRRLLRADAARHLPAARAQGRRDGHLPRGRSCCTSRALRTGLRGTSTSRFSAGSCSARFRACSSAVG